LTWSDHRPLFPHLTEEYKKILFGKAVREEYSAGLVGRLRKLAKQAGLSDKMSLIF
jgi:hypothetical protein